MEFKVHYSPVGARPPETFLYIPLHKEQIHMTRPSKQKKLKRVGRNTPEYQRLIACAQQYGNVAEALLETFPIYMRASRKLDLPTIEFKQRKRHRKTIRRFRLSRRHHELQRRQLKAWFRKTYGRPPKPEWYDNLLRPIEGINPQ